MACFADSNVLQGSVATYARCSGIFSIFLTANLPTNIPVKNFLNQLRFDRSMVPLFWPTLYIDILNLYLKNATVSSDTHFHTTSGCR